jgi:hypothetical protein
MADTDTLRPYRVGDAPSMPDSDRRYLADQLKLISDSIGLLVAVAKKLEARMKAHGI